MNLSLPSFSILGAAAATLVLLGACTNPVILATGGSGGSETTSTTGTGNTTGTGAGTTTGTGGSNACTEAGGTCELTGETCNGAPGLTGSCGASVGAFCCLPVAGCDHPCAVEDLGQTQCAGDDIETCTVVGSCSVWVITAACPANQGCNSAATKCVPAPSGDTCTPGSDVGCGCGCGNDGMIECTGGIPPTCNADTDCGATCSGFVCSGHQCVPWVCNPGTDEMCNDDAGMSALAGSCNADGTCACKTGFTRKIDGKCG